MTLTKTQLDILNLLDRTITAYLSIGQFQPRLLVDPLVDSSDSLLNIKVLAEQVKSKSSEQIADEYLTINMSLPRLTGKSTILSILKEGLKNTASTSRYESSHSTKCLEVFSLGRIHTVVIADEMEVSNVYLRQATLGKLPALVIRLATD